MSKSIEEWIELYNKKCPISFERNKRYGLFYKSDKGFCEIGIVENKQHFACIC